jgi:multicomponent Na+:H+ antiporter subunit E
MRVVTRVGLLVVLWLLAWGEWSVANLLSGVAVATAIFVAFPLARRQSSGVRLHPLGIVRLAGYVVSQLAVSNVLMTRQILSRRPDVRPGVVAHRLLRPSEEAVTVMTSIIALSPGTMTADVDDASTTIYVHFFRLTDVAAARASLARLERLVTGALTTSAAEEPAVTIRESP